VAAHLPRRALLLTTASGDGSGSGYLRSTTELQAADRYCQDLAGRHYENFSVASRILPAPLRLHLARIYAFARTTDDLGDESGELGTPRLNLWRDQVIGVLCRNESPVHPALLSLHETVGAYDLPAKPFLDLISANEQDQRVTEYATWEQLIDYCELSAAPVGRLVLRVFGAHSGRSEQLSDDVCIGLQLANFAQDVMVDRAKGRRYLVGTDVEALGIEGAVRSMSDRSLDMLASGRELEMMVPARLRMQFALYRMGGEAIIAAVRRIGYHTDQKRPHVTSTTKAKLVARALWLVGRKQGHAAVQRAV
jgi:squalene synthase HpnC